MVRNMSLSVNKTGRSGNPGRPVQRNGARGYRIRIIFPVLVLIPEVNRQT
jgi:hypothetical protein